MMSYFVYLLASRYHGTLYLGVTNDLARRVGEYRSGSIRGFTSKYGVNRLVWYEDYPQVAEAIAREEALKKWQRTWKVRLIEESNPAWCDLYPLLNQ
jgi:putative endonuclease